MMVSFALTKVAMDALRDQVLFSELRAEDSLAEIVNWYYSALFEALGRIWRREKLTIVDFQEAISRVSRECHQRAAKLLREARKSRKEASFLMI